MLILEIALGIVLATIILAFLPFIVRTILVLLGVAAAVAVAVAFWLWASSDPSDAGTFITIIFAFCALIYCGGLWEARRRRIERQSLHPSR